MTFDVISDPDPCNRCNYKILNSPDRAEGFTTYDQPKCDLMSWDRVKYDTWYRFNGSAGTAMPTHCVETMRCGAEAPGWLYGGHPKAAEGISARSVCFNWLGKCCYYKNEIKVKNCRGFFVYKFRDPPMNFLRYCGNGSRNGTGEFKTIITREDNPF